MQKQYKIATGWVIFIYIIAPAMIALFVWLGYLPFQNGNFTPNWSWILIPVSLGMIFLMIYGIIEAYKWRLIIGEDSITAIEVFGKKKLKVVEIEGFTLLKEQIVVVPIDKHKKKIKISKYTKHYYELLEWFYCNFSDLDEKERVEEEEEILNNQELGRTKEERQEKLATAQKITTPLNAVAWIVLALAIFYPKPYQLILSLALIIPLIAIFIVRQYNGIIKIGQETENSKMPSLFYAIVIPAATALLKAFDYSIFDYSKLWTLIVLLDVLLLLFMFFEQKEFSLKNKSSLLFIPLFALFFTMYSFGAVVHVNCYYDKSSPEIYTAKVISKRISKSRNSTSYYLELSAWGKQTKDDEVSVSKGFYNRMNENDKVNIEYREGTLGVSWFEVIAK
jgi:hypothetical protein